jgi:hypothetical protein
MFTLYNAPQSYYFGSLPTAKFLRMKERAAVWN